jgi:hypothetical protein
MQTMDQQFLELLIDQLPQERSSTYETLEEAISQHEKDFA